MAVNSMTGFARAAGSNGEWRWAFEIKSVNAKGLDLRLRMPPPFDRVEAEARSRLGKALARGTCFATLTAQREGAAITARVDQRALEAIAAATRAAAEKAGLQPRQWTGSLRCAASSRRSRRRTTRSRSTPPAQARWRASTKRSPRSARRAEPRIGEVAEVGPVDQALDEDLVQAAATDGHGRHGERPPSRRPARRAARRGGHDQHGGGLQRPRPGQRALQAAVAEEASR